MEEDRYIYMKRFLPCTLVLLNHYQPDRQAEHRPLCTDLISQGWFPCRYGHSLFKISTLCLHATWECTACAKKGQDFVYSLYCWTARVNTCLGLWGIGTLQDWKSIKSGFRWLAPTSSLGLFSLAKSSPLSKSHFQYCNHAAWSCA